ncbi:hypothetical protein AB0C21_35725, partial [Spirillospora sp. NPDC049024]
GDPAEQSTEPIKALAFNTLLSSQETDTHRAEPRSRGPRLRGNPSIVPDPSWFIQLRAVRPHKSILGKPRLTRFGL